MNEVLKWVGAIGAIWVAASILATVAWWRIHAAFSKPAPKRVDDDSRRGA